MSVFHVYTQKYGTDMQNALPILIVMSRKCNIVKQSHYRPGQALRVPGG
jgi:hypothetical protein